MRGVSFQNSTTSLFDDARLDNTIVDRRQVYA